MAFSLLHVGLKPDRHWEHPKHPPERPRLYARGVLRVRNR